jgi:hypothetical protein
VGLFAVVRQHKLDVVRNLQDYQRQSWIFNQQTAIWERCFYCPKCDTAIDPATLRTAPSASFVALMDSVTPQLPP